MSRLQEVREIEERLERMHKRGSDVDKRVAQFIAEEESKLARKQQEIKAIIDAEDSRRRKRCQQIERQIEEARSQHHCAPGY